MARKTLAPLSVGDHGGQRGYPTISRGGDGGTIRDNDKPRPAPAGGPRIQFDRRAQHVMDTLNYDRTIYSIDIQHGLDP
jgi:hypothetical protein